MLIATAIDRVETIVPFVEGAKLRIYDTRTGQYEDFNNPALEVTEGRRGAVLRFAQAKGVIAFVAPPETFCELSYQKAQADKLKFYHVSPNLKFSSFQKLVTYKLIKLQDTLPADEIAPSQVTVQNKR